MRKMLGIVTKHFFHQSYKIIINIFIDTLLSRATIIPIWGMRIIK